MIERQIRRKRSNAASRVGCLAYRDIGSMQLGMSADAVGCWLLAVGCSAGQNCVWALHLYICTQGYMSIDVSVTFDLDWGIKLLC